MAGANSSLCFVVGDDPGPLSGAVCIPVPEALDMLTAMNTGHEGSMSTCHANSPHDALRRLETMVLLAGEGLPLDAVRDQLHAAIDLVVEVGRAGAGGRRIVSVGEVAEPGDLGPRVRLVADGSTVRNAPVRAPR